MLIFGVQSSELILNLGRTVDQHEFSRIYMESK